MVEHWELCESNEASNKHLVEVPVAVPTWSAKTFSLVGQAAWIFESPTLFQHRLSRFHLLVVSFVLPGR